MGIKGYIDLGKKISVYIGKLTIFIFEHKLTIFINTKNIKKFKKILKLFYVKLI